MNRLKPAAALLFGLLMLAFLFCTILPVSAITESDASFDTSVSILRSSDRSLLAAASDSSPAELKASDAAAGILLSDAISYRELAPESEGYYIVTMTLCRIETELSEADAAALASEPRRTLNRLLFPGPTRDYEEATEEYSDLSVLTTRQFLHGLQLGIEHQVPIERGKTLLMSLIAIGEADERGMRPVLATINGQMRQVWVRDESVKSTVVAREKADPAKRGQVAAPFAGVVTLTVEPGQRVGEGQPVATIEAMKMEAAITSPISGVVARCAIGHAQAVEGGDLLVVVE